MTCLLQLCYPTYFLDPIVPTTTAVRPFDFSEPKWVQYLDMILKAWGDWSLFQDLLVVLRSIGDRRGGVSIANVATRWVLDQPAVGAVIIGECEISSNPLTAIHSSFLSPQYPPSHPPIRHVIFLTLYYVLRIIITHAPANQHGRTDLTWTAFAHSTGLYLGVRMGIAEHKDDNKKVFSFSLTAEDRADIQAILERSNGDKLIMTIGDCGAEYR